MLTLEHVIEGFGNVCSLLVGLGKIGPDDIDDLARRSNSKLVEIDHGLPNLAQGRLRTRLACAPRQDSRDQLLSGVS